MFWSITSSSLAEQGVGYFDRQNDVIDVNEILNEFKNKAIGKRALIYIDKEYQFDIKTVRSQFQDISWESSPSEVINLGFQSHYIWIFVPLTNNSQESRSIYFSIKNPLIDQITFYAFDQSELIKEVYTGDYHPYHERPINFQNYTLPLTLKPQQSLDVFVKIRSSSSIQVPLEIESFQELLSSEQNNNIFTGIFFGIMVMMMAYNFLFYINLREKKYFYYVLFTFSSSMSQLGLTGHSYAYLLQESPYLQELIIPFFSSISVIAAMLFIRDFFQSLWSSPLVEEIRTCVIVLALVNILLSIGAPHQYSVISGIILSTVSIFVLIGISFYAIRQGFRPAIFAFYAWLGFFAGVLTLALNKFGIIERNFFTENAIRFGTIFEIVVLSFGLADQQRQQKILHQEKALSLKKKQEAAQKARLIQESLINLSISANHIHCESYYQAAEETGGDWYGVIEDPTGKFLYIFVGDVTGHGLPSAVVTSTVSGALRAEILQLAKRKLPQKEALTLLAEKVNAIVCHVGQKTGRNMTMGFISVDLQTNQGVYLNAGHNPFFIVKRTQIKPLIRQGSVLGLSLKPRFSTISFHLEPGDIILGLTDGFLENTGPNGNTLNFKSALNHLLNQEHSPKTIIDSLLKLGHDIWQGHDAEDDLTAIAVQLD
ncbi:MAG: 7TM diverse intracellular signaling domain-containing protein [Oligoflexus sp.]